MCEAKLKIVLKYCQEFGMSVNVKKTKYFVINGTSDDTTTSRDTMTSMHIFVQYVVGIEAQSPGIVV